MPKKKLNKFQLALRKVLLDFTNRAIPSLSNDETTQKTIRKMTNRMAP